MLAICEDSSFCTVCPKLVIFFFCHTRPSVNQGVSRDLICILLITSDLRHLFLCWLTSCIFTFGEMSFLKMGCMSFLLSPKCSLSMFLDVCLLLDARDPHCSQILYLQTCLVSKIYVWPWNQYSWLFRSHSQTCSEKWKVWVTWGTLPSWGRTRWYSPFLFQLSYCTWVSFL